MYSLYRVTGKEISVPKTRYPHVKREYAILSCCCGLTGRDFPGTKIFISGLFLRGVLVYGSLRIRMGEISIEKIELLNDFDLFDISYTYDAYAISIG